MRFSRSILLRVLTCVVLAITVSSTVLAKDKKRTRSHVVEPESIDQEWNELPKTYHPTTPKAAADWLNAIVSSEPSPDQFSTPNDLARRDESIRNRIAHKGTFGILIEAEMNEHSSMPCELRYSPNEEKLSYGLGSHWYTEYKYSSRPTDNHRKVILESKYSDDGNSVGQNAFGAKVKVSRSTYKDISVAAKDAAGVGITSLSPEKARMVVPWLKCLVLFSPTPPFVLRQWDTKAASFDNPEQVSTEDIVLFGRIEDIWLIDSTSRQVLAKQR